MNTPPVSAEIAAAAARLIIDHGLGYGEAKRKAARAYRGRPELPSDEQVEDAVRDDLALFHAETQPAELHALRVLALRWMQKLQDFRPHLGGAVWRGTATRQSVIVLDLYCNDPKTTEIALLNAGIDYDIADQPQSGREALPVLRVSDTCPSLGEHVTLLLLLHDLDDQRGALKPDARGRSWRGDLAALQHLLSTEAA